MSPRPSITTSRSKFGLGRGLPNTDHVSAFVTFVDDPGGTTPLPSGFGSDNEKTFFSLSEIEQAGIVEGDANYDLLWYHLQQFYLQEPAAEVTVGIYDNQTNDPQLTAAVNSVVDFTQGRVKNVAVYNIWETWDKAGNTIVAQVAELQTAATALKAKNTPVHILYACNFSTCTVANIATLDDLRTGGVNEDVTVVAGESYSGGGRTRALAAPSGFSITNIGAALGTIASAGVHQSIANRTEFNIAKDADNQIPALAIDSAANRPKVSDISDAALDALYDKGYLFAQLERNYAGTYWAGSLTSVTPTSDYATIENVRTAGKAQRNSTAALTAFKATELYVDPDTGFLDELTIAKFKNACDKVLEQMETDGEISGGSTSINPEQDVLSTSKIEVTQRIVPVGVANAIEINSGFVVSLANIN